MATAGIGTRILRGGDSLNSHFTDAEAECTEIALSYAVVHSGLAEIRPAGYPILICAGPPTPTHELRD